MSNRSARLVSRHILAIAVSLSFWLIPSGQTETITGSGSFLNPQDGDTVVFLGDSITHQCLYTQYIEDFFYTRYPDRRIHFHAAGVGGDSAATALARFEDDVAAQNPDIVTIYLGMNDGQYEPFNEITFANYRNGMLKLMDRVDALGAQAVALSPTMFDHHQKALRSTDDTFRFKDQKVDPHYNALMSFYGAWLRETAGTRQTPFVNLWGSLNDITFQQRRIEPNFSVIEDSIHPGAAGHFIMAFSILSESKQERTAASAVTIVKRGKKWTALKNANISELEHSENGDKISFTFLARSLPWVVPDAMSKEPLKWGPSAPASLGYELTKAGHKLSAERLRITGLPAGQYELTIDDVIIGEFSHLSLGAKVELQNFSDTPQSQQSLKVALLNQEKNDEIIRPMRDLWGRVKGLRKKLEPNEFEKKFAPIKEQIDELHRLAAEYENRIYAAAQPVPRKYQIRRVPTQAATGNR
tara:strand:+ start:1757 stop:3166 length:1410 start_codon:yes stop_codon:yes gene_type:complete